MGHLAIFRLRCGGKPLVAIDMLYHSRFIRHSTSIFALSCIAATTPVLAQGRDAEQATTASPDTAEQAGPQDRLDDHLHDRRVDYQGEIIVSAKGLRQFDLLAGTSVLEGADMQAAAAGQIGDMLTALPGVDATGFSPGASRPVLRGFSGERVRVLVDGIGAIDVSNTSVDHAVTIDPLTAERIEVLRGPAVMLYGSQAIGGAVNVVDKRIPRRVPDEPVHIDAQLRADTASNLREAGGSLDASLGGGFVGHVGGSWRKSDDMEIAGFALSDNLRADLLADAEHEAEEGHLDEAAELREAADQRGTLPNSAVETWSANAGIAFFSGDSHLGASVGWYDTSYGIPTAPGAGHAHGDEEGTGEDEEHGHDDVTIALRQFRADLRGELAFGGGFLDKMVLRAGFSDYTHTEFEGGAVGTVFDVQGIEARAEFIQREREAWRGSFGTQYYVRDFDAEGAEAYVAPNRTQQFALFALQEYGNGPIQIEGAARFETTNVDAPPLGLARDFSTVSGALGLAYETPQALRFGINLSRAERAPSAEELYSDGLHVATQAYEIGDANLGTETAWGVEAYARGKIGWVDLNLAVYNSWFKDYIYQSATGAQVEGLPVFAYRQGDAEYFGVEGEASWTFYYSAPLSLLLDVRGDYIRAQLEDGTPLPRIPPLSLLGALEAQTGTVDGRIEVQWFDDQNRTAPFETATDGFTHVNAALTWRPIQGNKSVSLVLKADNIFDVAGRRHASFTKEFVPLTGRNFSANLRFSF